MSVEPILTGGCGNVPRARFNFGNDHADNGRRIRYVPLSRPSNMTMLRKQDQTTSMTGWLEFCCDDDDVRHMTDESLAPFHGNRRNAPVEPIDSWSRGIGRRLLVELSFESLHRTLSLEMELSSTIMKYPHAHTIP
ncbi:unnamed protein product [Protopolystoma xenopodis]|uniref:Uncharacterized protein n=1 Tax=Protopolystoma xenopodis TaxID=117903 RepID=A0A448XS35_9PLAT|nr:unnamed protein product [Protopolystoma xenopodis]